MAEADKPARYYFRPENRVKKRSDFLQTYSQGKCYRRRLVHVFLLMQENPDLPTRVGFTATRKVGGAVVRNRLKRMGRESFRLALPQLKPGYTIIVNFLNAASSATYEQLDTQLWSVWRDAALVPQAADGAPGAA